MASVFRKDDNVENHPKRNVFDMSCQNNLTLNFGKLVPVFCKEVIPGDSIKIDPKFGIRYLPQVFPVQTRQRASIKYYYVRNRPLWKDWPDFIGKTKDNLVPPYVSFRGDEHKYLRPSSLADYLGVPIHVVNSNADGAIRHMNASQPDFVNGNQFAFVPESSNTLTSQDGHPDAIFTRKNIALEMYNIQIFAGVPIEYVYGGGNSNYLLSRPEITTNSALASAIGTSTRYSSPDIYFKLYRIPLEPSSNIRVEIGQIRAGVFMIFRGRDGRTYMYKIRTNETNEIPTTNVPIKVWDAATSSLVDGTTDMEAVIGFVSCYEFPTTFDVTLSIQLSNNPNLCWCDVSYHDLPFASVNYPDKLRLSALPFRAVESIYNALVRNPENNPFKINGVPEYNKYLRYDGDGASTADNLADYFCNWADDRFTTALPSPQQGNAPLVGLTGTTGAVFTIGNEDGTQSKIRLEVNSNGDVVGVDDSVSTASEDLVSEMWNAVDYGISINDLRNVNSYQRWKENNIRGGYKYKDQISSHYGVNVRYEVLDMPEFIGGVSRDVNVNQVTQTVQNAEGNLGDIAGQSYIMGEGHSIEHYCDEHGFIIGLMCVYPMPLYQDTLPKYLIKSNTFDYYFPEFGKIGMQPITKKELAFSQSVLEENMDETFGYQRAWYDYLDSLDEVHGLYRTDFRNFLIARDFAKTPELGKSFLTIDNDDLNNTFYVDDDSDKLLGEVYHHVSMKRPLPLYGIPALE